MIIVFNTLSTFKFMNKEALTAPSDNNDDESAWAHDQQKLDYYYDDSHGYEIYDPDEDDENELNADVLTKVDKK